MSLSGHCRLCAGACGVQATTDGAVPTALRPDPADPVSQGQPCAVLDHSLAARTGPGRIRQPLRRAGEALVPCSWDEALAGIGAALVDLRVRDVLMTLVDCDEAPAADQLWLLLAQVLPQPYRAEALILAGFSAYVRGEGPLAGVCIEAVQAADPAHRMAGLLDTALQNGVRPEAIRGLTAQLPSAVAV